MPRFQSIDHNPQGDPCTKCWYPAISHRVYHLSIGDPCETCGLPASRHRGYSKERYEKRKAEKAYRFIGIDGEGQGRDDHKYVMMGASSEDGAYQKTIEAYDNDRLRTSECLDFLLTLPPDYKLFSYSFNYDLTKILTDVDNQTIYLLIRPELRQRRGADAIKGPMPVKWDRYWLNLQGTKFTVKRGRKRIVLWDIFKFYQSKFVNALKDWKVGTPELWDRMSKMKDKRSEFDKESREAVREYMLEECACMAALARKLVQAHEQAGLKLKTFYGAGSSGAAMLNVMGVREKLAPVLPEMREAVASAFFGGRFENSVIGSIRERVFNYDISSAYPYHTTFLPCLVHGTWTHTKRRDDLDLSSVALISYTLRESKPKFTSWGPFPFREKDGSICFPIESGGGWVWRDEYLQGERIFPHVQFQEAWIYHTDCQCRPFEKLPKYYVHRILLGKEGAGIVIKLAVNSVYGKLAQSVGSAIFSSWIWAGMITSGCRAQVLQALSLHKNWSNLLMVATDGIYTRERLSMPLPLDTGTADAVTSEGKRANKPLGGWEEKIVDKGIFVARPGIYFPLKPTAAEIKDIRGRGVGKGVVLENWRRIIEAWEKGGINGIATVANVSRFCGAKTCINHSKEGYQRAIAFDGIAPSYGNWIGRRVEMGFNPMPKRSGINPDGLTLTLRKVDPYTRSAPYDAAIVSPEARELRAATQEILEQPDADLSEFEVEPL